MNDRPCPAAPLLGIYLNDHLAGATAGVARIRHLVRSEQGSVLTQVLEPVAAEIVQDRTSLLGIMQDLEVPVRRHKVCAGWTAEKVARLKANGRLVGRSPLTTVVELELLRLGVEGKAAAWQLLRRLADTEDRLDARLLDSLLNRARRQQDIIERWRLRQASVVLRTGESPARGHRHLASVAHG